jgi:UDP-N-acetylmuramoylalanine--D-glutamate ligase
MIPVRSFNGKQVAVFGLGGSGLATAEALRAGGADVVAYDDGEAGRAKALAAGFVVRDLRELDWSAISALVLSPGVPLTHPAPHWSVELAKAAGVEVIGDIELLARERRAVFAAGPLVAITGTNGKSTTTALIAHLLTSAGRDVQLGGNIGRAVLTLEPPAPGRIYVIECSSFQIDLAPGLDPTIGVHLNLSPDHLDRHGTMENYAAIKERLIAGSELAIVGVDDFGSSEIAGGALRRGQGVLRISAKVPYEADVFYRDGAVHAGARVFPLAGIGSLRGAHNGQNAAAAIAAVLALGLSETEIRTGLATFPGLPHRMEEVGRLGKVIIINDSKATNADSSAQALASFEPIYWIIGGKQKEGGISTLVNLFPRVAKAYLIGAATEDFAATLDLAGVHYERSGTLDLALASAVRDAAQSQAPEPVVLLSPACASYDQFKGFEDRGDQFRAMVQALPGVTARGNASDNSEGA